MFNLTLILALLLVSISPASAKSLQKRMLIYNCDGVHFDRAQIMQADPVHCVSPIDDPGHGAYRKQSKQVKDYSNLRARKETIICPLYRSTRIDYGDYIDRKYSVTFSWTPGTHNCKIIDVNFIDEYNQRIKCDIRNEAASFRMPEPRISSTHFRAETDFSGAPPARGFGLIED
ncbi:BgTH12-00703 [Blumeria graminis f. sp. triticale]|uniref:BgtAcSP-30691 n=3 Tax=Blumeria graminis TaxID=34373 RepID=A0A9X9MM56_BLUGR|nr:hypothetical protein BGT96224_AcSP30691 [Blumeria graminis f. sp. tritici 96224]CAD6505209.1 BgTH12-00703 [Blumeria graminis f. sp. triticale]VDB93222.1 BgtAcSP-30691 [Blumeria graminis f. sp. tritici]